MSADVAGVLCVLGVVGVLGGGVLVMLYGVRVVRALVAAGKSWLDRK